MKRASSSGKKSHVPGDFKRLKAKVGKRAPQKINSTETKFRTATVKVQSQSVTNAQASQKKASLVSSKGKHFSQLMAMLNHPAANARSSALHGMSDAIKNTPDNIIAQHLSLIIPSLSKCFVDEDRGVRKSATSMLFQNIAPRLVSCNMGGSMRPFLQLILAYIGSALHSLDQDVRYDGCVALEALCTNYGYLFMEGGDGIRKLHATINAFTILLDDVSGGLASMSRRGVGSLSIAEEDDKKSKNRQSKNNTRAVGVLKSLVAVMKITTAFCNGSDILAQDSQIDSSMEDNGGEDAWVVQEAILPSMSKADLDFVPGGRTSNAIVWKKNQIRHSSTRMVHNIGKLEVDEEASNFQTESTLPLDTKVHNALFSKLRDRFVEVSQRGQPADEGIFLSPAHSQECSVIISCLRLLWNGYSRKIIHISGTNDSERKQIKNVSTSVLKLLLECFAIKDTGGNDKNRHLYDSLNASICMALSEFGSVLDALSGINESTQESLWVKAIFSYVSPQLEGDIECDTDQTAKIAASNTRVTLIKVVERLLLSPESRSKSNACLLSEKRYLDLIDRFGSSYFSHSNFDDSSCKAPEGRRAAALLISLLNQHLFDSGQMDSEKIWDKLLKMASILPTYLIKWRGHFPKDTIIVLATLLSISRNFCDTNDRQDSHTSMRDTLNVSFCSELRKSIEPLFRTSKKERKIGDSGKKTKLSVFEGLPRSGQTMLVSLIGVLRFPSEKLIASLAQICARSCLHETMIDYIMGTLQSINRTMSLQQYLSFLINASGINSARYSQVHSPPISADASDEDAVIDGHTDFNINFAFSYDASISRTCRYTLLSKSKNFANSYKPILRSWLDTAVVGEDKMTQLLKARAAMSILSCQALSYSSEEYESEKTIFHEGDFQVCLCQAIFEMFLFLPPRTSQENSHAKVTAKTDDSQGLNDLEVKKLTSPIVVLLSCVPFLLIKLFDNIENFITIKESNLDQDVKKHERLIYSLTFIVKSKELRKVLTARKDVSKKLQEAINHIEEHTCGGPLHAASGILNVEANALLGFK